MILVALVVQSVRSWSKVATMAIQLTVVALCTNLGGDSSYSNIRISRCTGMDCEAKRGCGNISCMACGITFHARSLYLHDCMGAFHFGMATSFWFIYTLLVTFWCIVRIGILVSMCIGFGL